MPGIELVNLTQKLHFLCYFSSTENQLVVSFKKKKMFVCLFWAHTQLYSWLILGFVLWDYSWQGSVDPM